MANVVRMKQLTKTHFFDRMHRASVWALIGLTGYGLSILGAYAFRYFREIRPMQQELRQKQKEESIRQEQLQREQELLQKQSEAETLHS